MGSCAQRILFQNHRFLSIPHEFLPGSSVWAAPSLGLHPSCVARTYEVDASGCAAHRVHPSAIDSRARYSEPPSAPSSHSSFPRTHNIRAKWRPSRNRSRGRYQYTSLMQIPNGRNTIVRSYQSSISVPGVYINLRDLWGPIQSLQVPQTQANALNGKHLRLRQ
jgi:hypothetical protein